MNATRRKNGRTWLLIWSSFLLFVFSRNSLPGLSEPHYVGKARHFADPTWCHGDLFMESANAHLVFYAVQGPITRLVSPDLSIVLGRGLALAILAWGWLVFGISLTRSHRATLWGAWIFLGLAAYGNFSGEWVVGTVESKVYSYGFVFLGLTSAFEGRWRRAALMLGLAISFHPVVGGWATLCLGGGILSRAASLRIRQLLRSANSRTPLDGPALRQAPTTFDSVSTSDVSLSLPVESTPLLAPSPGDNIIPGKEVSYGGRQVGSDAASASRSLTPYEFTIACGIGLLASLPGLIPVLSLIVGVPKETGEMATYIQVFGRLNHHLDPMTIPKSAFLLYGLLLGVGLILSRLALPYEHGKLLRRITMTAVAIAVIGLLIGWHPERARGAAPFEMPYYELKMEFLKYYPFRMADTLVPLFAAFAAAAGLSRLADRCFAKFSQAEPPDGTVQSTRRRTISWLLPSYMIAVTPFAWAIAVPHPDQKNPSRMPASQFADWVAACRWISGNVPAESEFLTFSDAWGFKWFAERPEYVAYKDCPQDAAGLVEWNRRVLVLSDWWQRAERDGISPDSTRELARLTGATHLITSTMELPWLEQIYPTTPTVRSGKRQYRVYQLSQ